MLAVHDHAVELLPAQPQGGPGRRPADEREADHSRVHAFLHMQRPDRQQPAAEDHQPILVRGGRFLGRTARGARDEREATAQGDLAAAAALTLETR